MAAYVYLGSKLVIVLRNQEFSNLPTTHDARNVYVFMRLRVCILCLLQSFTPLLLLVTRSPRKKSKNKETSTKLSWKVEVQTHFHISPSPNYSFTKGQNSVLVEVKGRMKPGVKGRVKEWVQAEVKGRVRASMTGRVKRGKTGVKER